MTRSIRFFFILLLFPVLWGCAPNDEHVIPFKERLELGKPIVFNQKGQQVPGCRSDWQEARLKQQDIENIMLMGGGFDIKSGAQNCYRIGQVIPLYNNDAKSTLPGPASVTVVSITLFKVGEGKRWEDSYKLQMNSRSRKDLAEFVTQYYHSKMTSEVEWSRSNRNGVVQVTTLSYVPDSADRVTEAAYKGEANRRFENSKNFFEKTSEEKPLLSGCNSAWVDVRVSRDIWSLMKSDAIRTAWVIKPGAACLQQGSEIKVVEEGGSRAELGKIKIGIVQEMTLNALKGEFLKLGENKEKSTDDLLTQIRTAFQSKNNPTNHLTLFDFEVLP